MECHKETRRLKRQLVNDINDQADSRNNRRNMGSFKDMNKVASKEVILWAKRIEAQQPQKAMLEIMKETKELDIQERQNICKNNTTEHVNTVEGSIHLENA